MGATLIYRGGIVQDLPQGKLRGTCEYLTTL